MKYPGLGIIGCEKLAGMYGVNEGIIDGKGTGVRHLFYDGFDLDLIHSAVSLIKDGEKIYYGNRTETRNGHPVHTSPVESYAEEGFCFTDKFEYDSFTKIDRAFGYGENTLGFQVELHNKTSQPKTLEVYAYVILRPQENRMLIRRDDRVVASGDHSCIAVVAPGATRHMILEEGPTGFIYRLTSALLYGETFEEPVSPNADSMSGVLIGKSITLPANGTVVYDWNMLFSSTEDELCQTPKDAGPALEEAKTYWDSYMKKGHAIAASEHEYHERVNRIAIKSAMIHGFVPADITGFYYSDGMPSYYARDSMMVARAFLLSGHYEEAKQVITYLKNRKRKASGEFYQRYNGLGEPSEGANNNVFHQLDSIGYFTRNIRDYYQMTGEHIADLDDIRGLMHVLLESEKKNGMVGPEGGVNEGVFGPAFITSSNMYIHGGVKSAIELLGDDEIVDRLKELNQDILRGIESTYIDGEGYQYGYVSYHDDLVKKYDTPQYFGLLYGFDDTENMRHTHENLIKDADFFNGGIGYSEQEYHHGPWIFNTCACAEYAWCIGDMKSYKEKMDWVRQHSNGYGLMPEAIDGDNENKSYINPLVWACAEFVSACQIEHQQET